MSGAEPLLPGPLERRELEIAASGGLRTAAVRSAGVAGIVNIVTQIIQFGSYLVLARLAPPAVFGAFAAGSILQAFGEIFTESGMTAALLQRRERVDAAAATVLASTFVGGVMLALLALAASPLVGLYFHSHEVGVIAAAISGCLVVNGVTGVPGTLLQRRFAISRWLVEPFATLLFGVASGVGLVYGLGPWALVIGWYASTIFRASAFWVLVRWRPQLRLVSWSMWRELTSYARHILGSVLLNEAQRVTTTALIGRYLGRADLGRFRFAWRLAQQATVPLIAANAYTIQPALVRLAGNPPRARAAVLTSFRIVCLVAFPLGASLIPLGNMVAVLMLGETWRGVGTILVALAPMTMGNAVGSVSSEIFKGAGRPQLLPRMAALGSTSTIALLFALVTFGAQGAAWAWSTSAVLVALYSLSRVPGATGVAPRELLGTVIPPLAASLLAASALFAIDRLAFGGQPHANIATLGRLGVDAVLGLALYVGLMLVVARHALREFVDAVAAMVARRPRSQPQPG